MHNNLDDLLTQLIKDVANSHRVEAVPSPIITKRSGSIGYGGLTGDINQRLANVREEIKGLIAPARKSVEEEIAQNNRDKILLALVNFLGGKIFCNKNILSILKVIAHQNPLFLNLFPNFVL